MSCKINHELSLYSIFRFDQSVLKTVTNICINAQKKLHAFCSRSGSQVASGSQKTVDQKKFSSSYNRDNLTIQNANALPWPFLYIFDDHALKWNEERKCQKTKIVQAHLRQVFICFQCCIESKHMRLRTVTECLILICPSKVSDIEMLKQKVSWRLQLTEINFQSLHSNKLFIGW